MKKNLILCGVVAAASVLVASSCGGAQKEPTTQNPVAYVTGPEKIEMLTTLTELDSLGRFYELDYTADYKLDEMLKANVTGVDGLTKFIAEKLLDKVPEQRPDSAFSTGCSMFAASISGSDEYMMGRNYDFCHVEDGKEVPITALMVKTAPKGGKKSICFIDTYWLGYRQGFYKDGKSDLSMLMGAPYCILDGVNEDGFAIGVLHLDGQPTIQSEEGKPGIWTTIAMRMVLDRASTVDEAVEMLKQYNMSHASPAKGSMHFFMADAKGDYAVVEYAFAEGVKYDRETGNPDVMKVFKGKDFSYVTNFYVDPAMAQNADLGGLSDHGKARYLTLRDTLTAKDYKLTPAEGMSLLQAVSSAPKPEENTSHTQWSALYNLNKRSVEISILREYGKKWDFKVE